MHIDTETVSRNISKFFDKLLKALSAFVAVLGRPIFGRYLTFPMSRKSFRVLVRVTLRCVLLKRTYMGTRSVSIAYHHEYFISFFKGKITNILKKSGII